MADIAVPAAAVIQGFRLGVADIGKVLKELFGIKLAKNEEPGWLGFDNPGFATVLNTATTVNAVMSLDASYDFVAAGVYQISHVVGDVRATQRPFLWDVQMGSSDRHLSNGFTHSEALGGSHMTGPLWFSKLAYLARQTRVPWTLAPLSADDIRVYIYFIGYRIYDVSMQDLT